MTTQNWNKYIGTIWHSIFRKTKINKEGVVVEVAPGSTIKVGNGLADYGFKGTLYIIEPNVPALNTIERQYKKLLPEATIISVPLKLDDAICHIHEDEIDIVVSNHPLDDMIAGNALSKKEFDQLFTNHYDEDKIEDTRKLWNKLVHNFDILFSSVETTIKNWEGVALILEPKFLAISQYKSYFFKKNNLTVPDTCGKIALERFADKLFLDGTYRRLDLRHEFVKDSHLWLVTKNIFK